MYSNVQTGFSSISGLCAPPAITRQSEHKTSEFAHLHGSTSKWVRAFLLLRTVASGDYDANAFVAFPVGMAFSQVITGLPVRSSGLSWSAVGLSCHHFFRNALASTVMFSLDRTVRSMRARSLFSTFNLKWSSRMFSAI